MIVALHQLIDDWIKDYEHFRVLKSGEIHGLMCDCPVSVISNIMSIRDDRVVIYDITIFEEEFLPKVHETIEVHAADKFFFDKLAKYMRYHCAAGRSTQNMD